MASTQGYEKSEDFIESWVELSCDQNGRVSSETMLESSSIDVTAVSFPKSVEKLLIDAQRESAATSRPDSNESSHRGSPRCPASPNTLLSLEEWRSKQDCGTDWIWDWSSRPEAQQSFDKMSERLRHPARKPGCNPFSVRNTQVMKRTRLFSWANLPTLFLTHACTFVLGAAAVFIYLKKYCRFSGIAQVALD